MTLLAGRYTLDVPLGDSDLGTVWNAHDETGTPLVVVTLEADAPAALQERFRAHAKALVKASHPSLVRAIAEGDEGGVPYLVLERLVGESMTARLESGPSPTVARVVEIGLALAEALAIVHAAGIAHGDVEPGNVLLVDEGGKEVPKLIGFALNRASLRQELGVRMSLPSLGPIAYAAPEQARGDVLDGPLADQASLAALLYAALGGRPPHVARDVAALSAAIGTEKAPLLTTVRRELAPFASTFDRALSSDPKKRFVDVAAFGRALKTAGTLARAIATTQVPLGPRSGIGDPPAPALPRGASLPKPAAGLGGARIPSPGKVGAVFSKPGAPKAPGATSTPQPPPKAPSATSTPQPPPKAPEADAEGQPPTRTTQEIEITDLLPAIAAADAERAAASSATSTPQPPPRAPGLPRPSATSHRSTEELDVSELETTSLPPSDGGAPELDAAELQSLPPEAAAPPPGPDATPGPGEASVAAESEAPLVHGSGWRPAPAPAPPPPPSEAKPPPPPSEAKPPPPPSEAKPPPSSEAPGEDELRGELARGVGETASASADGNALPVPPFDDDAPPSPPPPSLDDDEPSLGGAGGRPAWVLPVAVAGAVVLALVSWLGYGAMQSPPPPTTTTGHTLTVTAPPPTSVVAPPPTSVVAPPPTSVVAPPPTVAEIAPPPPPTVLAHVEPPPPTHVEPPPTRTTPPVTSAHTTPPATRVRPPTTGTRPPTTGTRPPTTGTRPPTTGARPPPTTTSRPTVVSDPGF